jgi:hypothetical protein
VGGGFPGEHADPKTNFVNIVIPSNVMGNTSMTLLEVSQDTRGGGRRLSALGKVWHGSDSEDFSKSNLNRHAFLNLKRKRSTRYQIDFQ